VALAGKLEDVQPAEILHFLAMSEKTGKLNFTTGRDEGLIVFRNGKIIYASSNSLRETFGSIIVSLQLVTESQLHEALLQQHRSGEDKRLGRILVEMGAMSDEDLHQVLHHQVIHVLREMFGWRQGFFQFRNLDLPNGGEVEVDAQNLIVETPLDARRVALDAARQHDEDQRDQVEAEREARVVESGIAPPMDDDQGGPAEQTTLREVATDVTAPVITGETVREIFDSAMKLFSRGVIFAVQSHSIRGLAQFGLVEGDDAPSQRVRRLWLPIDEPSIVAEAIERAGQVRGRPERNQWNEVLFQVLGGNWPDEGVALSVVAGGRVAMVFYGDNEPEDLPVGSTTALEEKLVEMGERLEEGIHQVAVS
jgi:hypothetical protein